MPLRTIACIATGPSLTPAQVETARRKGFELYVCNDAFRLAPDATLLHACNWQWWDARWDQVKDLPCEKWTTRKEPPRKYGINYIAEREGKGLGLSEDPTYLHHGHGSGFQLLGMAYHARPDRIVLLGYDLKYAEDYSPAIKQPGSTPRHFFGEYEPALQHWPSKSVHQGVHVELVGIYETAARLNRRCPIINCTPGSAIKGFPTVDIEDLDDDWATRMSWKGGLPFTECGQGSLPEQTANIRRALPEWCRKYSIRTVNDAGAGDLQWKVGMDWPVDYRPFDLVVRHPSVTYFDITEQTLPGSDMVLCRMVLNHLSEQQVRDAIRRFRDSTRYLAATQFDGGGPQRSSQYRRIDLRPMLGEPLESVQDAAEENCRLALWRF